MQVELKVNCGCNCKPMDRTPPKFNTDIIAPTCFWREEGEDYSLQTTPIAGESYKVKVYAPLRIDLYEKLWFYYDTPYAFANGDFMIPEDIEGARFCYGQITAFLDTKEHDAVIEFKVEKTLSHTDIINNCPVVPYPEEWLGGFIGNSDAWVERFGPYYIIKFNAQGDLGQTAVAVEHDNEMYVLFMHDWGFHRDEHYAGKYLIGEEFKRFILEKCG